MKKAWIVSVAVLATVGSALAGDAAATEATTETSRSLHFATYYEEIGDVTVVVGSRIAGYHPEEDFVPLTIAVRVVRRGDTIKVAEESFTLFDAEGNRYQAVGLAELRAGYDRLNWDWNRLEMHPLPTASYFNRERRTRSRFYPAPQQGPRLSPIKLRGGSSMSDLVYFPRPKAGLDGVLTLRMSGGGLAEPIDVRFEVPAG